VLLMFSAYTEIETNQEQASSAMLHAELCTARPMVIP
jgi:hypothetical protein